MQRLQVNRARSQALLPPLPRAGIRSALWDPLSAPGVRVLLLSLRLQLLVALASELRRLSSVNKLSDPRPQIHLFAHTQLLASAIALDPGGGGVCKLAQPPSGLCLTVWG